MMDKIENDHLDHGRSGEYQHNPCYEDRIPRNHYRCEEDDCYMEKNIKLKVSNFDGRLDS